MVGPSAGTSLVMLGAVAPDPSDACPNMPDGTVSGMKSWPMLADASEEGSGTAVNGDWLREGVDTPSTPCGEGVESKPGTGWVPFRTNEFRERSIGDCDTS